MRKQIAIWIVLAGFFSLTAQPLWAGDEYQGKLERGLARGLKNIIGAPLEIPLTIQRYHEGEGRPVIRHTAGFVDGTFRMIARFVNGVMDTLMVTSPGEQDGLPMEPETLF